MSVNLLLLVASVYKTCTGWLAWLMYGGTLHKLGARLLYFPSVARATLRWRRGKQNWYDRVDETVLLGALPFRSQTKEVCTGGACHGVQPSLSSFAIDLSVLCHAPYPANKVRNIERLL